MRVPRTEHHQRTRYEGVGVFHERVGVLFFNGGWGSVWGPPRRLQVPYVIPRPGVPRHMYMLCVILYDNALLFIYMAYIPFNF